MDKVVEYTSPPVSTLMVVLGVDRIVNRIPDR